MQARPYRVVSRTFRVRPWSGITVRDLRVGRRARVSFAVGPRHTYAATPDDDDAPKVKSRIGPIDYPDSYRSPVRFIRWKRTGFVDPDAPKDGSKVEWYCFTCSFRPWLDSGNARRAHFLFVRGNRRIRVRARKRGGRWVSTRRLRRGYAAYVPVGGVRDRFGNLNGSASARVRR